MRVAAHLERRYPEVGRTTLERLPIWSCSEWGLPCDSRYREPGELLPRLFTLTVGRSELEEERRYVFCGTFLGVTPTSR